MKKFIQWLARLFDVDIYIEKIVTKEIEVEKQIALEGIIDGDVTVKGNLYITGTVYVAGNISAHKGMVYGMSYDEVKLEAEKEISVQNISDYGITK